jgi:hypothetical protein
MNRTSSLLGTDETLAGWMNRMNSFGMDDCLAARMNSLREG